MRLENLLSELSDKMGLPPLRLNAHGMVRLVFDKHVAVDIEVPTGSAVFHLVTLLGKVPAAETEGRERLFARLLEANMFGHGTGGAVISVDVEADEIFLHRSFDRHCTESEFFISAFAAYVDAAEEWIARLATFSHDAVSEGKPAGIGTAQQGGADTRGAAEPVELSPAMMLGSDAGIIVA